METTICVGATVRAGGGPREVGGLLHAVLTAWQKCEAAPIVDTSAAAVIDFCRAAVARQAAEFPDRYGGLGFRLVTFHDHAGEQVERIDLFSDAGQGVWASIYCSTGVVTHLKFGVENIHEGDPNFSEYSEKLEEVSGQLGELVAALMGRGGYCYVDTEVDEDE